MASLKMIDCCDGSVHYGEEILLLSSCVTAVTRFSSSLKVWTSHLLKDFHHTICATRRNVILVLMKRNCVSCIQALFPMALRSLNKLYSSATLPTLLECIASSTNPRSGEPHRLRCLQSSFPMHRRQQMIQKKDGLAG